MYLEKWEPEGSDWPWNTAGRSMTNPGLKQKFSNYWQDNSPAGPVYILYATRELEDLIRFTVNQLHVCCASPPPPINIVLEKAACSGDSLNLLLNGSPKNSPLPLILTLHVNSLKDNILRSFFRGAERSSFNGRG